MRSLALKSLLRRTFMMTLLVSGFALAAACDEDTDEMDAVELVAVVNGDTFISMVADHETVAVYICDGTDEGVTTFDWLVGDNDSRSFDIANADLSIVGDFAEDGSASGTLSVKGVDYEFTATSAGGYEGMYYVDDGDYYGGWTVIGDATRGAVINRLQTGSLAIGANFSPSVGSLVVEGVTLTPVRQTVLDYK